MGILSGAGLGGNVDRSDIAGAAFKHCVLCPPARGILVWLFGSI